LSLSPCSIILKNIPKGETPGADDGSMVETETPSDSSWFPFGWGVSKEARRDTAAVQAQFSFE